METKIIYKGYFYLPNNPSNKIPGILTYDPNEGIELEVFDNFNPDSQQYDFVLGIVENKGAITLYKLHSVQKRFGKIFINRYRSIFLFVGHHFHTKKELKFKQASSTMLHFDEWYNESNSFNINTDHKNKKIKIEYTIPPFVNYKISQNKTIYFSFVPEGPMHSAVQKDAQIKQISYVNFQYRQKTFFQDIVDDMFHFRDLITLLTNSISIPQKILLTIPNNKQPYPIDVELLFYMKRDNVRYEEIHPMFMLFPYFMIQDKFPNILISWFNEKNKRSTSAIPFFNEIYNSNLNTVDRFLSLSKSLEAFHRDYINTNRVHFKKRVAELFRKYRLIINPILNIKSTPKFSEKVKNYRNDFTHSNTIISSKTRIYVEMHYLTEAMKLIIRSAFLSDLGLDNNFIKKRFVDSSMFSHLKRTIKC